MARSASRGAAVFGLVVAACGHHETPTSPTLAEASTIPVVAEIVAAKDARADAGAAAVEASASPAPDLQARTDSARARFGQDARIRRVEGTFLLVEVGRPSPLFDQAAALLERALPALFDGRFSTRPDKPVTVLLFQAATPYLAYYREHLAERSASGTVRSGQADYGIYLRRERELAVDLSRGAGFLPTLTHEMVHPLMETDFPDAPLWLQEGIASLFEAPVFGADGSIHGVARNWRHEDLQAALTSSQRGGVRLDALFGMSPRDFKGDAKRNGDDRAALIEARNYALARSVCAWMDEQGKLWAFYRAWRDGVADDETGEQAFARVMGATPKEVNEKWASWAR